ncbi:MAG: hypothetical protein IJ788_06205 [Oscillospiraceae bacterium]|nr:hypothetical protein [Oscillospiraceae bacterium]
MKAKKPYEEITVSSKHLPLRIALFALAIVIAAGSIGYGVSQLGRKDPGWYTINAAADEDALMYANGIRFEYYMEGSSDVIKAALRLIEEQYSSALAKAYKETDPVKSYPGIGNLAALNAGESVKCSPELFAILKDAYAKTLEGRGYNMFAGAYYAEWNSIIYSNDPTSYDPANDEDERARLDAIRSAVNDLSNFALTLDEATLTAALTVSDSYKALVSELEIDSGALDLNLLRDAYMLGAVREELETEDWHRGYFATESGLGVYMSECDGGTIEVFGEGEEAIGAISIAAGDSLSMFRGFGYYEADGELRSPYFTATGSFGSPLTMVITLDEGGDPVACAYHNIKMLDSCAPEKGSYTVLYTLKGEEALNAAE